MHRDRIGLGHSSYSSLSSTRYRWPSFSLRALHLMEYISAIGRHRSWSDHLSSFWKRLTNYSLSEKLWIKIWGDAYDDSAQPSALYELGFFAYSDTGIVMDRVLTSYGSTPMFHNLVSKASSQRITLPGVYEHPLFYVGVYAAIGLANVIVGVSSTIAQYTGALRASRRLFRQLLVTVVRYVR